jgi:hypothetical protein
VSSQFQADWLSLREPVDHAARSQALLEQLSTRPLPSGPIVDLGAGHGSNLRYLARRLESGMDWLLLDQDDALLRQALANRPTTQGQVTCRRVDLAELAELNLPRPALVTASALLDLASADWLGQLVECARHWQSPMLMALSVDGRREFMEPDGRALSRGLDEACVLAFNQHQRQAKGLGAGQALGPDAAEALQSALLDQGFEVQLAAADWQLRAGSEIASTLGQALLDGWHEAVSETGQINKAALASWHRDRRKGLLTGQLGLRVGHLDLLALPPDA